MLLSCWLQPQLRQPEAAGFPQRWWRHLSCLKSLSRWLFGPSQMWWPHSSCYWARLSIQLSGLPRPMTSSRRPPACWPESPSLAALAWPMEPCRPVAVRPNWRCRHQWSARRPLSPWLLRARECESASSQFLVPDQRNAYLAGCPTTAGGVVPRGGCAAAGCPGLAGPVPGAAGGTASCSWLKKVVAVQLATTVSPGAKSYFVLILDGPVSLVFAICMLSMVTIRSRSDTRWKKSLTE